MPGIFFSLLFGLVIGSFLNVLVWRLPRREKLGGRSKCTACGKLLLWLELFPVLSWVVLGAKCRGCKQSIHWRYPSVEVVCAVLFALVWSALNLNFETLGYIQALQLVRLWFICAMAVLVFVIDLEHFLILDKVVLWSSLVLLLLAFFIDSASSGLGRDGLLASGLLMSGILICLFSGLWFFSRGRWLGFGDVKFMLPFGLALGFPLGFLALGLASLIGSFVGLVLVWFFGAKFTTRLPFGVFLSLGLVFTVLYGQKIWTAYIAWITSGLF